MGQTRMFRDRVVSMEQTLEGGEKHLPLLKELCREALPDHEFRDHALDHERDLFVMDFQAPDGTARRIAWTRMVLFDAERIPTLTGDPAAQLRKKIVDFIRGRAERPEIVVTFRHLEDGWVDTPEPRREGGGRRRRRGGRGGRGVEPRREGRGGTDRRPGSPAGGPPGQRPQPSPRPSGSGGPSRPQAPPRAASPSRQPRPEGGAPASAAVGAGAGAPGEGAGGKRRRRIRRRRRGGRGGGPGGGPSPAGTGAPGRPE